MFGALGERLQEIRERYVHGPQASLEFLRELLALTRDAVAAEKAPNEVPCAERGKAVAAAVGSPMHAAGPGS